MWYTIYYFHWTESTKWYKVYARNVVQALAEFMSNHDTKDIKVYWINVAEEY